MKKLYVILVSLFLFFSLIASTSSGIDTPDIILEDELSSNMTVHLNGPYMAYVNESIGFIGSSCVSGGVPPYTWFWDFGDGDTSDKLYPIHRYAEIGEYVLSLTVTDSMEDTANDSAVVTVIERYGPPDIELMIKGGIGWTVGVTNNEPQEIWLNYAATIYGVFFGREILNLTGYTNCYPNWSITRQQISFLTLCPIARITVSIESCGESLTREGIVLFSSFVFFKK